MMVTAMTVKHDLPGSHTAFEAKGRSAFGPLVDEHEAIVRHGLPVLESVDAADSEEARQRAYSVLIARQRAEFVEKYGDPYGVSVQPPVSAPVPLTVVNNSLAVIMYGAA